MSQTEMLLSDALERVHALARDTLSALDQGDEPVDPESRESFLLFEDLAVNYWEELDDICAGSTDHQDPGAAVARSGALLAVDPGSRLNRAVADTVDLAERAFDPETDALNARAISLLTGFWMAQGRDVLSRITLVNTDPAP